MAALRRANLAQVLIVAACSSATPSTETNGVQGVSLLENLTNDCEPDCVSEDIAGAALAQGVVWLTRAKDVRQNNNQGVAGTDSAQLFVGVFGADAGVTQVTSTSTYSGTVSSAVGVTTDGSQVYFASSDSVDNQLTVQNLDGGSHGAAGGVVMGVAPSAEGAVVGVVPSCCGSQCGGNMGCNSSSGFDTGNFSFEFTGFGPADAGGVLYGFNFVDGGVSQLPASFDMEMSNHLLVSDAANVYWVGGGTVWSVPLDLLSSPMTSIGSIGTGAFPVGLSTSKGVVAWSAMQGTNNCGNGPCTFQPTGCTVATTTGTIYQSSKLCMGLAIDATNAYFAIIEQRTTSTCCNSQDGGPNINNYIVTTGIARVSLTGTPQQTPSILSFSTDRMYGPRRFLADDTYVYGIDPAFALRIPKSAFPP
jgi:hypothetical protein